MNMTNFNVFFFTFIGPLFVVRRVLWSGSALLSARLICLALLILFLELVHFSFCKFCIVLGAHMETYKDFFKSLFWAKMIKSDPDRVFSCFSKIKSLFLPGNALMLLWHFAKTACVGKIQYSIYSKKYSQPVKSEYSLIISTSWMNWFLTFFLPYR